MISQREAFAQICEHLCTHNGYPGHGYSQVSRLGDGTKETVTLTDGTKIEIAGGDRDCSSMVITALQAVGVDTKDASYTGNLLTICETGLFAAHPRKNGACVDGYSARRGDLYLNVTHHVAVCQHGANEPGGDTMMQFSISETGGVDGKEGDQTGQESNIKPFAEYWAGWDYTVSWNGDGKTLGVQEEDDDMTECILSIPQSGDMPCNVIVYVCGDRVHDIADPEALSYLSAVYKAVHGKDIPCFELSSAPETPEFPRFIQALRGGIPDPSIIPNVDQFSARSANRADGCKGAE